MPRVLHFSAFILQPVSMLTFLLPDNNIQSDSSDNYGILRTILRHSYHNTKRFLLVELGKLRLSTSGQLEAALNVVKLAISYGWYVVIAASSGADLQLNRNSRVFDIALCLKSRLKDVESQNFTEREAIKFICTLGAAEQGKEKITWQNHLSKATNGNPLLLRFYQCACTKGYNRGYRLVQDQLGKIVNNLLTSMSRELYQEFIEDSFTWLTYAIEERHIPKSEEDDYSLSFVARECLTCKEDKDDGYFTLHIVFPGFYETFVKKCSQLFKTSSNDMIKRCPSVQGLIFEHEFLTHTELRTLTVSAINEATKPRTFSFCINPAYCQMQDALSSLSPSCLHYLRPGHRAIDAVCLTAEIGSGENYLLLIQVSLSYYANHKRKALDIHAKVVSVENEVCKNDENEVCKNDDVKSVGEYYRTLPGVKVESKNVMFVYASPKEIRLPTPVDFLSEVCHHTPRSGKTLPAYWYGFIAQQSPAADLLNKIYTFIV